MPDSFEVERARQRIETYGPSSSINRSEAEKVALAQMDRESRQNDAAIMFAGMAIGRLLGPIIGFVIAVVFLGYFFAGLALLGLTLFGGLVWLMQFRYAPRSSSVVFAMIVAGAAVVGLHVPETIPLGLFDFDVPDWGGPAWNGMLFTVPLGMVIFSVPLGVLISSGLQDLGIRLIQNRSVGLRMVALLVTSALPLLIGLPLVAWVGVFGLPGAGGVNATANALGQLSNAPGILLALEQGWSVLQPRMFDGTFNAASAIAGVLVLLVLWGVIQTFLLKRAADQQDYDDLLGSLSDY